MATLAAVQSSCAFASPDPLDRAIQRELAALATVEADHRSACRWLDEWSAPEGVKEHLACRLEARHQTEQEAHVLRLAALHQQQWYLRWPTRPASRRMLSAAALAWIRVSQSS